MRKLSKNLDKKVYRIIDANFNRTQEGLRVCEEVARFILGSSALNIRFKKLRHSIKAILKCLPRDLRESIISFRESASDVGRGKSKLEKTRADFKDIFIANIQRAKESLRVLEEFFKIIDTGLSAKFKRLRYKAYTLEKDTIKLFK